MNNKESNAMVATGRVRNIRDCIFTIRDVQVMLDRDLAELYGVPTKALNQAVKRNAERFPEGFVFQLSQDEFDGLRSQIVTSNETSHLPNGVLKSQIATSKRGGLRYRPYAFTEHGIVMLASLLKSKTASEVSVRIVNTFVAMRKFILANAQVFQRLESVEQRQIVTDGKMNEILNRLNAGEVPSQGVFYNGQLWDARALVLSLVSRAKRSLILIDNWANTAVLDLFTKKREGVRLTIFTSEHYDRKHVPHRKISPADVKTFNAQYPKLAVRYNETFHDRFLIIDDKELYLVNAPKKREPRFEGEIRRRRTRRALKRPRASLKDLGSKCFAFTKLDPGAIRGIKKSAFHPHPVGPAVPGTSRPGAAVLVASIQGCGTLAASRARRVRRHISRQVKTDIVDTVA